MIDPNCPYCYGTGALDLEETHLGVPKTTPCRCLLASDLVRNMESAWRGLSRAGRIKGTSPLLEYAASNLYITAPDEVLRFHLRNIALRLGPKWYFKVTSDADLMVAWLSPASLLGKEILDPDAAEVSSEKATLVDLIEPPALLILRLGVKNARNSAMPEVLHETLSHRAHVDRPVWVVDQPTRRLDPAHLSYSDEVLAVLNGWEHRTLNEEDTRPRARMTIEPAYPTGPGPNAPLASSGGARPPLADGGTQRIELPTRVDKKKKRSF